MTATDALLQNYPYGYISDVEIELLLNGTANSRHSKVKRLLQKGMLLHIRRGLYCLTEKLRHQTKPHPYELAQRIYAPSYISLESALSYHQLIPERVFTITSASTKRSKEFNTPLGLFSYQRLPADNFYIEVELIHQDNYRFFMAKPWKAICDYVYCSKKSWRELLPLLDSLRIDKSSLPMIKFDEILALNEYYQSNKLMQFLNNIKREFSL